VLVIAPGVIFSDIAMNAGVMSSPRRAIRFSTSYCG
jgi:hypothetical protein